MTITRKPGGYIGSTEEIQNFRRQMELHQKMQANGQGGQAGQGGLAALGGGSKSNPNAYLGRSFNWSLPQAMPGQLEAIASQLSAGFGQTPQQWMSHLDNVHSPMNIKQFPQPGTPGWSQAAQEQPARSYQSFEQFPWQAYVKANPSLKQGQNMTADGEVQRAWQHYMGTDGTWTAPQQPAGPMPVGPTPNGLAALAKPTLPISRQVRRPPARRTFSSSR